MNKRKAICLAYIFLTAGGFAQLRKVPDWTITTKVLDEEGKSVDDAVVKISWYVNPPEGQSIAFTNIIGKTRQDGIFTTTQRSGSIEVMCEVTKTGYYASRKTHEFAKFKESDPAKWAPSIEMFLRKVENPVGMYAKRVEAQPPANDKLIGYDLMRGDWVAPFGKGAESDILFTRHYEKQSATQYEHKITVSFAHPGDGIQVFRGVANAESELRSPREAPDAGFEPKLVRENSRQPGRPNRFDFDESRLYFFRVRTVLDEKGAVKSALYGKIYGDFMRFRYFLNPTPNSRNVEFDPGQNLLKGLAVPEQVNVP